MTKKHFALVASAIGAQVIKAENSPHALAALSAVAEDLADKFAQENPNFDRTLFFMACGLPR